jgi:hypothetical protein
MARLNSFLLITLLLLVMYISLPSSIDARKILKIETQVAPSLKGTLPSIEIVNNPNIYHGNGKFVAHLANNERVLVSSNPSPGAGH